MYIGRDMTELTMVSKNEWKEDELAYFHHSLQQILPYLNAEGQSIYKEIVKKLKQEAAYKKVRLVGLMGQKFLTIKKCSQSREHFCYPALMGSKTPTSKCSESKEFRWGSTAHKSPIGEG